MLKKVLKFLQSMRFGMVLLGIIAALSVIGTVIPQGQSVEAYTQVYGTFGSVIAFLGLDHLYSVWYYVLAYVLLCLNLIFCSVIRLGKIRGQKKTLLSLPAGKKVARVEAADPDGLLRRHGFKKAGDGYIRHSLGLYGSFVTHLGLLVMLIACACVFKLEDKKDYAVMVGEAVTLEDGTMLHVDDFSMGTSERLDYVSDLTAVLPDGSVVSGQIRVNQPKWFGRYKVYQQSYDYAGQLDVSVGGTAPERVTLDGGATISLDGENGISYMGSFGTYLKGADGQILPPGYPGAEGDPVEAYMIAVFESGSQEIRLAEVDETFEVGGVTYTFRTPQAYPGLRVKTIPPLVMPMLYLSFAVLLLGLYLCFFHVPSAAQIRDGAVFVAAFKDIDDLVQTLRDSAQGK